MPLPTAPTSPASSHAPDPAAHYENFPVASWLCPPRLRAPIAATYWFARTADDLADEGDANAQTRLDDLAAYRADLAHAANPAANLAENAPFSTRWPHVFAPLHQAIRDFALPVGLLEDLLSAFEQDVHKTRDGNGRVAAHEILISTPAVRNLIRENKIAQINSTLQTGQTHGMQTLDQSLQALVRQGVISPDVARSKGQHVDSTFS